MPNTPEHPYKLTTPAGHSIVEFPLSTVKIINYKLPIAGGGYFRLYPYWLSRLGLSRINNLQKQFIFYLHPWEIDPEQPKISAGWFSRFRHYNNLDKCEDRLKHLMKDFKFGTTLDVLNSLGLIETNTAASSNSEASRSAA